MKYTILTLALLATLGSVVLLAVPIVTTLASQTAGQHVSDTSQQDTLQDLFSFEVPVNDSTTTPPTKDKTQEKQTTSTSADVYDVPGTPAVQLTSSDNAE